MKLLVDAIGLSFLAWVLSIFIRFLIPDASYWCSYVVSAFFVLGLYIYIKNYTKR